MLITKNLARDLAKQTKGFEPETVRDECDIRTGGKLDAFRLDLLTQWVLELREQEGLAA